MEQNKMEVMDVKKLVLTMSIPLVISMIIQALYNIVDSIFVARISTDALYAVSLCYPVQTIITAVACGTGVGFNTLLSRYLGQKKYDQAKNVVMHGLLIALLNGAIFALLGILFSRMFIASFSKSDEIIQMGSDYIRICTLFCFGVFVQITYERIMQATGHAFYNMVIQSLGALTNIILDPIFIFGYFGLPAMGVRGAAIATILGQIFAMILGIWITEKRIHLVEVRMRHFHFSKSILIRIYRVGIPAILMQSLISFMTVFMNRILISFSDLSVAVFNIYYKLQQFLNFGVLGITNALIPIVSYNFGAGKVERIRKSISFSFFLSIGIMAVGLLIFQIFPKQLLSLFEATDAMLAIGIPMLRLISLSFIFVGINLIFGSCFQALNHANISLFITLMRQVVLLLPLTYFLAHRFGLQMAWISFLITEGACALYSVWMYRKINVELNEMNQSEVCKRRT